MTSAFGGGSLLGLAAATMLPSLPPARFGLVMLLLVSLSGLVVAAMAFATTTPVALAIAVLIGTILGYTNVSFITWVQRRIPRELMGRVMSLLVFSSIALVPISMAIAGALVQVSLDGMFLIAGLAMSVLTLSALLSASVRRMGLEPVVEATGARGAEPAVVEAPAA
jgi:hypothetical protein